MKSFINEENRIVVATDAETDVSSQNKNGLKEKDAWFGVFFRDNSNFNHKGKFKFQVKDHNIAEFEAAVEGLKHYSVIKAQKNATKMLKLYTDSRYVSQHECELTSKFPALNIVVKQVLRNHRYIKGADKLAGQAKSTYP